MSERVLIPMLAPEERVRSGVKGSPGWFIEARLPQFVTLRCMCGALATLEFSARFHTIDAAGVVNPSLMAQCCDWHVWGQLEGWDGGVRP